jgi:DNA-binding response OmpR family regulator
VPLSAREADLLELLLRNARRVVSREQAVAQLWQGAATANVVDRYVSNLRRKLGEPPLIETVRGVGFVLGR